MDELIKIGALNLEDLEINRSGELSERQKRGLKFWVGFWIVLASIEMVSLAIFICFRFFFQKNWLAGLVSFALFISLTYMCVINAKPYWFDLNNDDVKTIAGKLFKHASSSGKGAIGYCSIQIGQQRFSVSPAIYDVVALDEFYRLYYAPHSRRVVNIEPL